MKSTNWRKGLKRLYFVACGLYYFGITAFTIGVWKYMTPSDYAVFILIYAAPIFAYIAAKWIYKGFSEDK